MERRKAFPPQPMSIVSLHHFSIRPVQPASLFSSLTMTTQWNLLLEYKDVTKFISALDTFITTYVASKGDLKELATSCQVNLRSSGIVGSVGYIMKTQFAEARVGDRGRAKCGLPEAMARPKRGQEDFRNTPAIGRFYKYMFARRIALWQQEDKDDGKLRNWPEWLVQNAGEFFNSLDETQVAAPSESKKRGASPGSWTNPPSTQLDEAGSTAMTDDQSTTAASHATSLETRFKPLSDVTGDEEAPDMSKRVKRA
jgi:hypothetical protein